jgi:hypothetical protein
MAHRAAIAVGAGHRLGHAEASRAAAVGGVVDEPALALDHIVQQSLDIHVMVHVRLPCESPL